MRNSKILREIKSGLKNEFGELISKVILFGSRIDKSSNKDSDYDVLIMLKELIEWQQKDRILDVIADLNLKYDCIIDAHIVSESELSILKGKQPYIQKAIEMGIAL